MISVIVPIFKVEPYLRQCIHSLVEQTYKDFEIILVDDGSPDNCPEICDEYAQKDERIKVIHKPNGGLVSARKAGMDCSCGEYITFVDGDDWIEKEYIEQISDIVERLKPDVVAVTDFYLFTDESKTRTRIGKKYEGMYDKEKIESDFYPFIFNAYPCFAFGTTLTVWSKIIRRDIIKKYLQGIPDDIQMGEDVAISLPCMMEAESIYFTNLCGYNYRKNPTSITNTFDKNAPARVVSLLNTLREVIEKQDYPIRDQIEAYAAFVADITMKSLLTKGGRIEECLGAFDILWNDPSVREGMKARIPVKSRLLLQMARWKQVWFLYAVRYLKYPRKLNCGSEKK